MDIEIENIAGITRGSGIIDPGINTLSASNWQGKSSFIRAIETVFGTADALTAGKDEGAVTLHLDGDTYTVRLTREHRTVVRHGQPVLEDEYDQTLVDLFAFLGEDNEVRRAVRNDENLADYLTRPLELEDIDAQIRSLGDQKQVVESDLAEAKRRANELVSVRQRKSELESDLADLRDRQAAFEDAPQSEDHEDLGDLRAERERVTDLIERLENTLERSRERLSEAHEEYESLDVEDPQDVEAELQSVREDLDRVEEDRELVQSIYSANKRLVEEDRLGLLSEITHNIDGDTVTCWICDTEVTRDEMEKRLQDLGDTVLGLREEAEAYEKRIDELESRRDEIRRDRRRKKDLEGQITDLESTIEEREESLAGARERLEVIEAQIADLEADIEETTDERSDIESEIKYKEAELEDLEAEIEECEAAADRVESLETERDELADEIAALRERKDSMQRRIREAFDESIREIVPRFETSFESARLTSEFELVVARDGREVDVDALSEGEVELLGLVTAIAGFEAYDVADRTPVILLDRLGGLADENLATLGEYLDGLTGAVVMTTYPENSAFGDNRIDPTEWHVVPSTGPQTA